MKRTRIFFRLIPLLFVLILFGGLYYVYYALPIGTGYTAKYLCSSMFVIGRGEIETFEEDIKPGNILFSLITSTVDHDQKMVTSKGLGLFHEKTAMYRPGLGCTLMVDTDAETLIKQAENLTPRFSNTDFRTWPRGDRVDLTNLPWNLDVKKLNDALEFACSEPVDGRLQTRAVIIVYRGQIIGEKYAEGITEMTPLLGWSMSKTVTGLLMGMMVNDGEFALSQNAPIEAWQQEGDPRSGITIDHLMTMTSGLGFREVYGPFADATNMLYESYSMAGYSEQKALRYEPGTHFYYASGTTNILMKILFDAAGGDLVSFHRYIMNRLYRPLGMSTALFEPDASGVPVGSSYMYASARDWARIGLFMLNNGVIEGRRLLPDGWIEYMTTPNPVSRGTYGAQTWLNAGDPEKIQSGDRVYEELPESMYYLSGHNHQNVFVFPEQDLIVVRLGTTHDEKYWEKERFLTMVLGSIGVARPEEK